ncbi:hypothetical protein CSB20_02975 [bacterium DOLZORAL124_64_63]|nr:MAG: hypothetical protein CSB20_02975 [bacterium DOLZORAL124_64_63]
MNIADDLGLAQEPEVQFLRVLWDFSSGNSLEAIQAITPLIGVFRDQSHHLTGEALRIRGHNLSCIGDTQQALQDLEAAYGFYLIQEKPFMVARVANTIGLHFVRQSEYNKAAEWFERANTILSDRENPFLLSQAKLNGGIALYKAGLLEKAMESLTESLILGKDGEWPHRQCFAHIALGNVYRMTRDFESAQQNLTAGYTLAQAERMSREEALALEFLGDVYRDQNKYKDAHRFYARSMAIAEPLAPEGDVVSELQRRIGETYILQGRVSKGLPALNRALELTRQQGDRFEEAVTLRVLSQARLLQKRPADALELIASSCAILEEIGAQFELAISRLTWAELIVRESGQNPEQEVELLNDAWRIAASALEYFGGIKLTWWSMRADRQLKQIFELRGEAATRQKDLQAAQEHEGHIVYRSKEMEIVLSMCDAYARMDVPILIRGDTGTGKELIARRLHQKSNRKGQLVTVNMASISPAIFEREFFGHVKGSVSGADDSRIGYAELADGGTLFLDEIGDMPLDQQAKILRLLEDGYFQAVGDPEPRQVNLRLIAATNVDLKQASKDGRFRSDLFYRLCGATLSLPALKNRPKDIIPLLEHFLSLAVGEPRLLPHYLDSESIKVLLEYAWPGNVRELVAVARQINLQFTISGAVGVTVVDSGDELVVGTAELKAKEMGAGGRVLPFADERERIVYALRVAKGKKAVTARMLGMSRSSLYRKLEKYRIG